uniref:Uncharacterized protein n=1 Tax=Pseudomonas fluorescens (strain SBW25) TaxID=216595 RepID=A0A0G4E4X3_PSEFS|nr:hypothetical protein [Pseudomonas fluorescens]CEK42280.1 hypothetical protein PQBR57_0327 [Pseudomonas fluorescens SBW25]
MQQVALQFSIRQLISQVPGRELGKDVCCSESDRTSNRERLHIEQASDERDTPARQQRSLPLAIIALLGTGTDREVAKSTGRAESTIRTARIAHGIPKFPSATRSLDEQTIEALGTKPDADLAREAGRSESSIRSARTRRGIPTFEQTISQQRKQNPETSSQPRPRKPLSPDDNRLSKITLTQDIESALGLEPDRALAKKAGISPSALRWQRIKRGITPYIPSAMALSNAYIPDAAALYLMTWASDAAVAKQLGITTWKVIKLRAEYNIPGLCLQIEPPVGLIEALGTKPDCELAIAFKLKRRWVSKMRKLLKIPKHKPVSDVMQSVPESLIMQLGKLSDRKLGQVYGISAWYIRALRDERGIKPKQPKRLPTKVLP